jgi:hypothetical protein
MSPSLFPGQRVQHPEFGEGVVVEISHDGYVRAFFGVGEKQIPARTLAPLVGRAEKILGHVAAGTRERLRRAWLVYESYALPLMESAAALTAAKIDLLPHQVVLTHRIATASPRRFPIQHAFDLVLLHAIFFLFANVLDLAALEIVLHGLLYTCGQVFELQALSLLLLSYS